MSVETLTFDVTGRIEGAKYEALLRSASPLAASVGLIVRSDMVVLTRRAQGVLEALAPYLMRSNPVSAWPGTRLFGDRRSRRYLYRLQPETLDVLVSSASDLYEWINPELPEDLHFLRADGSTVLGTVAQEHDAWVEIHARELEMWSSSLDGDLSRCLSPRSAWE
jgi:hypothetical protein